jgi:hypothetical protein
MRIKDENSENIVINMRIKKNITLMYSIFTFKNALYVLSFTLIKIQARVNDKIIYIFVLLFTLFIHVKHVWITL